MTRSIPPAVRPHSGSVVGRLALVLGVLLAALSSQGAAFLRLTGIPGDSRDQAHLDWIVVTALGHSLTPAPSPIRSRSSPSVRLLKSVDRATPLLVEAAHRLSTTRLGEIELTRQVGGSTQAHFYRITLTNVVLTSYRLSATAEGTSAVEEVELAFDQARWVYTQFAATGKPLSEQVAVWDFLRDVGDATTVKKGFTAKSLVQPDGTLGVQWIPEPGHRYHLLHSAVPEGPYLPVRDLGIVTTSDPRWAELPRDASLGFFLLQQDD